MVASGEQDTGGRMMNGSNAAVGDGRSGDAGLSHGMQGHRGRKGRRESTRASRVPGGAVCAVWFCPCLGGSFLA
jgi:hypothetical protein